MDLRLLITDNTFLLTQKGKVILENTFVTNEEMFGALTPTFIKFKNPNIECLLSGNRLVSQSITIRHQNPEPFIADEKLLKHLIENAEHSFLEVNKNKKLEVVQTLVSEIKLNGYQVKEVKKQKVNDITISVFFGALPAEYKKQLENTFGHGANATFFSFAKYVSDRIYNRTKMETFLTCSVYEFSTDISVRKSGGSIKVVTLPLGTHHAAEYKEKNQPIEVFQLALDGETKKALGELSEGMLLPSQVYTLIAPDFESAFETMFKSESYHSACMCEKGFEVTNMSSILM